MTLQRVQQGGGKAEVALHEFALVFGTVDARQIEHKVRLTAPVVQQGGVGVQVVFKNRLDGQGAGSVFAVHDGAQILTQIASHKPLCAGH